MLDLAALAQAPACPACGTQFLGPWCPMCRAGMPRTGPEGFSPPYRRVPEAARRDPALRAAGALGRMCRRLGRAIAAARSAGRLCPVCFHLAATRCRCGSYAEIQWFGETG
jgi:hypothetical protein